MIRFNSCFVGITILLIGGCGFGKQAQLDTYVASEKQNLPKVLFADVEVVDMAAGDSELIYFCDAGEMNAAAAVAAKDQLLKKADRYVKENKQGLSRLIDAKIKMTFVARNNGGKELFRFSVNPWEL